MKLNAAKCKEMFINFRPNSNSSLNHIVIGSNVIEQVENYKIFIGVIMNNSDSVDSENQPLVVVEFRFISNFLHTS